METCLRAQVALHLQFLELPQASGWKWPLLTALPWFSCMASCLQVVLMILK